MNSKKLMCTKDISKLMKLLDDPTMEATGPYANGYRDAIMQIKSDVKKLLGVKDVSCSQD
jgi:hypothetical protein